MNVFVNGVPNSLIPVGISDLGTLVFDNIVFPAGIFSTEEGLQVYNEVKFDAVTVTISRAKEIQISRIAGRTGTIKEYVGHGDYTIKINAIVTPENLSVAQIAAIAAGAIPGVQAIAGAVGINSVAEPTGLLYNIRLLDDVPDRVAIRSKFLQNIFDINFVVIENTRIERGTADSWNIAIELLSDKDIDLNDF